MNTIDELIELAQSAPKSKVEPRTLNAYRHGLTGQVRFCTPADEQAYKKHCLGYLECYEPAGRLEADLCQAVADGRWRMKHAAQIENAIVAITLGQPDQMKCDHEEARVAFAHAYAWLERGKDLNLLTLYERRFQREQAAARQAAAAREDAALAAAAHAAAVKEAEARFKHRAAKRREPRIEFSTRPRHPKNPVYSPPPAEIQAA